MTIETAIFNHLAGTAGVAALVADRIYPQKLPQSPAYPAVVYHRISTGRDHTHSGADSRAGPRWQFDCHAISTVEAQALATQVRVALDGFSGWMGAQGGDPGVYVDGGYADDEGGEYDDSVVDAGTHSVLLDVVIDHQE